MSQRRESTVHDPSSAYDMHRGAPKTRGSALSCAGGLPLQMSGSRFSGSAPLDSRFLAGRRRPIWWRHIAGARVQPRPDAPTLGV